MKITVVGSGAWGTALANLLCENGHTVTLWARSEKNAREMSQTRVNPRLEAVQLHQNLLISSEISCVGDSEMVVFAVPSFAIRQTAAMVRKLLRRDALLVSVTKGIEPETGLRMTEILTEVTGLPAAALSGPSHAEEVARGIPTGCVAACADSAAAERIQDAFMSDALRV